ncbi:MAG: hypothetical protein ACRC78_05615 [Planktothrix sp.]
MNNSQKELLTIGAGVVLLKLITESGKNKIGTYPKQEETIISSMVDQIGDLSINFPDNKMTSKQRKELLKKSLEYSG